MGYYTHYSLEVKNIKNDEEYNSLVNMIRQKGLFNFVFAEPDSYCLNGQCEFDSCNDAKWYDHETDMREIATTFPNMTFCLHGEGEDSGDVWNQYFHDNDTEYCGMIMPPPRKIKW